MKFSSQSILFIFLRQWRGASHWEFSSETALFLFLFLASHRYDFVSQEVRGNDVLGCHKTEIKLKRDSLTLKGKLYLRWIHYCVKEIATWHSKNTCDDVTNSVWQVIQVTTSIVPRQQHIQDYTQCLLSFTLTALSSIHFICWWSHIASENKRETMRLKLPHYSLIRSSFTTFNVSSSLKVKIIIFYIEVWMRRR